jgi:hypothetical protein
MSAASAPSSPEVVIDELRLITLGPRFQMLAISEAL